MRTLIIGTIRVHLDNDTIDDMASDSHVETSFRLDGDGIAITRTVLKRGLVDAAGELVAEISREFADAIVPDAAVVGCDGENEFYVEFELHLKRD